MAGALPENDSGDIHPVKVFIMLFSAHQAIVALNARIVLDEFISASETLFKRRVLDEAAALGVESAMPALRAVEADDSELGGLEVQTAKRSRWA
jgi:hypothetical protein